MSGKSRFLAHLAAGLGQCVLLFTPVAAFNTSQHLDSSAQAIAAGSEDAADIRKFGGTIQQWSGGLCALNPLKFTCTPAEELAHANNQRANFCLIADNGGPFLEILRSIVPRYSQNSKESLDGNKPGKEGAYVLMGAAIHLIEDQASMPHGANVRHGECPTGVLNLYSWYRNHDNFEGWNNWTKTAGELTRLLGDVRTDKSYAESLTATQRVVPNVVSRQFTPPLRPWLTNIELFSSGDPDASNVPYVGQWPVTAGLFGKYGGPGHTDIYQDFHHPQLYYEQGSQAADFAYHFLLNMSKSLPPTLGSLAFFESSHADGSNGSLRTLGDGQVGSTGRTEIVLQIAENRTSRVYIDAYVKEGGVDSPLVTTGAKLILDKTESPLGIPQSSELPGELVWDNLAVDLLATSDSKLELLPFKSEIRVPINGRVQGRMLPNGRHEFCVRVRDVDGNSAEEACGFFKLDSEGPVALSQPIPTSTDGLFSISLRDSVSGIATVSIAAQDGRTATTDFSPPLANLVHPVGPLPSGSHSLIARDATGNETTIALPVERKPVRLQVTRSGQAIADTLSGLSRTSALPASGDLAFTAESVLGPIAQLEVLRDGSPVLTKGPPAPESTTIVGALPPGQPAGSYIVRARDAADHSVETTFTTVSSPIRAVLEGSVAAFDPVSKKFNPRVTIEAESPAQLKSISLRELGGPSGQLEIDWKPVSGTTARAAFGPLDPAKAYLAVAETGSGDLLALQLTFTEASNNIFSGLDWSIPIDAPGATFEGTSLVTTPGGSEQFLRLNASAANGTFTTAVQEIHSSQENERRFLLGGALRLRDPLLGGSCVNLVGQAIAVSTTMTGVATQACQAAGPQNSLAIKTGDAPDSLSAETTIATGRTEFLPGFSALGPSGPFSIECPESEFVPLGRYVQAKFYLTNSPSDVRFCERADDPPAIAPIGWRARNWSLAVHDYALAPAAQWLFLETDPNPATAPKILVRAGASTAVSIPGVGGFKYTDVSTPGEMTARPVRVQVPAGFAAKEENAGTVLDTNATFDSVEVTLNFDPTLYHPSQLEKLVLLHITDEANGAFQDITTARGPSSITGRTTSFSPFVIALPTAALAVPLNSARMLGGKPEASLSASNEGLSLIAVDTTTLEAVSFLAAKALEGYTLVGSAYRTEPPGAAFLGGARLLMRYSTETISQSGLDSASALLANFEFSPARLDLPPQSSDVVGSAISLELNRGRGMFGVFARPRDRNAPTTRVAVSGPSFTDESGRLFVSTSSAIGFAGTDSGTLVGLPSGFGQAYYKVDPSPSLLAGGLNAGTVGLFDAFQTSVTLTAGSRTLAFGGVDAAGNFESLTVAEVLVDSTPPASLLLVDNEPASAQSGSIVILRSSAVAFAAVDPGTPASGPGGIEYSLDGGAWLGFEESLGGLSTGTHLLRFRAVDLVENREGPREVSLDVRPFADSTPPLTRASVTGARYLGSEGREFLSTGTVVTLRGLDPFGREGPPSGVAEIRYSLTGTSSTGGLVRYERPFSLPEGQLLLNFGAIDESGNVEVLQSSQVFVDATAPRTDIAIEGPVALGTGGEVFVSSATSLALVSTDPVSNAVNTGVAATLFLLDPSPDFCGLSPEALPVAISTAPQGSCANPYFVAASTLSAGRHHIAFLPVDNVGNLGVLTTATIHVDADPPSLVTDLVATLADDVSITLAWTAPDDEVAGLGLYRLWYATVAFNESTLSLALPARDPPLPLSPGSLQTAIVDGLEPGTTYFFAVAAVDRVANQASLSLPLPAMTRLPDHTPPVTTQTLDGFSTLLHGTLYISTGTGIVLASTDPAPPGQSARGVAALYYAVDPAESLITAGLGPDTTALFSVYPGSFTLAEGPRTLIFGAADKAGNYERVQVASFTVVRLEDHDAPTTRLVALGTSAVLGSNLAVTAGSLLTLLATDDLPVIGASGLRETRMRLDGIETPYSAPFTLASGSHSLTYWSVDKAGNIESPKTLTVIIPPGVLGENFSLSFGGFGSATGKFNQPADVAVDASGNLFVSDNRNWRVQKFSPSGVFLLSFGSKGTGPGQFGDNFTGPQSLTVSKGNGNILVCDVRNRRIQEFTGAGAFIRSITASPAFTTGSISIDTDRDGNIFVMDDGNQRVYRFSNAGQQVGSFTPVAGTSMRDLAISFGGSAFIGGTNGGAFVIQRYALTGELLDQWLGVDPNAFHFIDVGGGALIKVYDQVIDKVAVDLQGSVFVGDDQENSVRIYSSTGGFVAKFGPNSGTSGTLSGVAGLGVDAGSGKVYVADYSLNVVKGYSPRTVAGPSRVVDLSLALQPDGTLAAQWTAPGAEGGVGTAAVYELRQSTIEITAGNYATATTVGGVPAPAPPGTIQTAVIDGLSGGATVYLALRTYNSGGAVSEISNVPGVPVPFIGRSDVKIGPRPEVIILSGTPLSLVRLDPTVGVGADVRAAAASVSLTAVSGVYDLLPNGPLQTIATGFITIQVDATRAAGFAEGELGMYTFEGGAMIRLPGQTYDAELARFTAHLTTAAPIGVFGPVEDVLAPVTRLEVDSGAALFLAEGGYLVAGTSKLRLTPTDPISKSTASGVASTVVGVNGGTLANYQGPFALPEGRNTVQFRSTDYAGNAETLHSSAVLVDASAPHAHLVIRESTGVIDGNEVVSAAALFELIGIDPVVNQVAAGVEAVEASLDGAPFVLSTAPFSLALGSGELAFRAEDRVGNLSTGSRVTLSKPPWPGKGYAFAGKFGSKGSADNQFTAPDDIAMDVEGNFFVSDSSKLRIFKFDRYGQFLFSFGGAGSAAGKFGPLFGRFGLDVTLDANDNIFVTDNGNRRVQKFGPDGTFLLQITTDPETGANYFGSVSDLSLDSAGNLWVLDSFVRLKKFDPSGTYLGTFDLGFPAGQGYNAYSFTFGPDDTIYVQVQILSTHTDRIFAYDRNVQVLRQWNSPSVPVVSDTDFYGNVFAAWGSPRVINVFTPIGTPLSTIGTGGGAGQNVASAAGAAVDKLSGRVYITDSSDGDIKFYDVDQVAPAAPTFASPVANAALRTFTPLLVGSAEGLSSVSITEGDSVLISTMPPSDGLFQVRLPALTKGLHMLKATARDKSGNVSPAAGLNIDLQYPNPSAFSAGTAVTLTSPLYAGAVKTLKSADFDNDGRPDVLAFGRNGYVLFRGLANAAFSAVSGKAFSSLLDECSDAATGDINGDGAQDAVAICRYDSTRLAAVLGTGTTSLGVEQSILSGIQWSQIVLTDWNRDRKLDIVGVQSDGSVKVLYGALGGTFQSPVTLASGVPGAGLIAADMDLDGIVDLVSGTKILYGDGSGGVSQTVTLSGAGLHPEAADFNKDGVIDLWVTTPGQFSSYLGRGSRSFTTLAVSSASLGDLGARQTADFNRDGIPDILLDASRIVPGTGDGGPGTLQTIASATGGNALLLDADGDGLLDIVQAANEQSLTSFRVFRNLSGPPDATAPNPITAIVTASPVAGTLALSWSAPGDDGAVGTVSRYDIKFASYPIDGSNFDAVQNPEIRHAFPVPASGGTVQTAQVGGFNEQLNNFQALPLGTTYYIRIRATDEVDNATMDSAAAAQVIQGADLAISSSQVRFYVQDNSLIVAACPENKGPATSPLPEIAIVSGPSSGTPTDLASVFWTSDYFHFPPGDCHQGTTFNLFDSGDEFARSFPVPSAGRHAFGVYLRMFPAYVPLGLDPDPTNDFVHLTVGIGEDGRIDESAPSAVTDLRAELQIDGKILLSWTAPGDDASSGTAKSFEFRVSSQGFAGTEYESQTILAASIPVTAPAGALQSRLITGFPQGTTVYFGLRTFDDADNPSAPSNIALAQAPFVAMSPTPASSEAELTFISSRPVTVDPIVEASTQGTIVLAAAGSQGITPASGLFEIGPDGVFDPPATLVFRYSTATLASLGLTVDDVALYEFFTGQGWVRVVNQVLDAANGRIIATLSSIASEFGIFGVVRDRTSPVTALTTTGGSAFYAPSGGVFRSSATQYGFLAEDPIVHSTSTGVAFTEYRVATSTDAPFQRFSDAFNLPEGVHPIEWRSQDNAGNLETLKSTTTLVDATPPVTALQTSATFYVEPGTAPSNRTFVAQTASYALNPEDPVVAGVASGDAETFLAIGTNSLQSAPTSFSLLEGIRLLSFQSRDRVDNLEALNQRTLFVDGTAPRTALLTEGPRGDLDEGRTIVLSTVSRLSLVALDPEVESVASGVRAMSLGIDTTTLASVAGTFSLEGPGSHILRFQSVDNVGNLERPQVATVIVDTAAPNIAILEPLAGSTYVARGAPVAIRFTVIDAYDPAPNSSAYLVQLLDRGSPRGARPSLINVANGQSIEPLDLDDGVWELRTSATDFVRNAASAAGGSFSVLHDVLPPRTTLAIGQPQADGQPSEPTFLRAEATLTLTSSDDLVVLDDAIGLGVTRQEVSIDSAAVRVFLNPSPIPDIPFQSTFTLIGAPDGLYGLAYHAVDSLGNTEAVHFATVALDNTAPLTTFSVAGTIWMGAASGDGIYASANSSFTLSAIDPVVGGVASGLHSTEMRDGDELFHLATGAFTLPPGRHLISFYSQDRLGNLEAARSTTVYVDAAPPVTVFQIGSPSFIDSEGTRYVTPASSFTLSAEDPVLPDDAAGSGVERIEVAIDGGAFVTYVSALTFAEGRHTVQFRAVDRVGNVEVAQSLALRSDASAPLTSLAPLGGRQAAGPDNATFYASSDTRFTLASLDPVSADVASGLELTRWQDSGGPFQTYSSPIALAEGSHLFNYQSQDRVANLEVLRSTTILIDATAPQSVFTIGTPTFVDAGGTRYVTPATSVSFSAADPALPGGAAGSGVERIEVAVDGGAYAPYSDALTFPEGRHTVQFRAIDRVGNVESAQTLALRSDNSAPQAAMTVQGGTQAPGPDAFSLYTSSATQVVLAATDPLVADVASGVDFIRWQDNGGPLSTYSAPLTLAEGAHLLAYQSLDRVENLEVLRSTTILLDAAAPQSAFAIGAPSFTGSDGTRFISPAAPVSFTAQDPNLPGGTAGSGVARIEVAVDGRAFAAYPSALTFPEGRHTIQYRAIDRVGNTEATQSLALRSDNSAPQTSLVVLGGRQVGGRTSESFYASSDTRFGFPATDPTVADVASGVDFTRWQDSGGAFQAYSSPIALAEGSHLLAYQSQDHVANIETLKSTTVIVDASAPNSAFAIGNPSFVDGDGTRYITPATPVSFSAQDPGLPGGTAGSGVERIDVAIDGGAFSPYTAALTFAEGRHTVLFRAADRVGNVEATQSLALRSDASAPRTSMAAVGGRQAAGPDAASFYASGDSRFVFPASDPVASDVASGVDFTRWRDGSGALQTYSAPVALAEGAHQLAYQSQDKVLNLEVLRSTTVLVDANAPQSAFAIGTPSFVAADGTRYITPATPVTFSASDPALPGGTAGSSVDRIEVAVDGAAFTLYSAALTFAEGRHTVQFRAVDRVGNSEAPQTLALRSDATPPQTAFSPSAAYYSAGGHDFAPAQFTYTLPASDPLTADVVSGVAETTFAIDAAPQHAYTAAFSLTEGIHTVSFGSRDNVSNLKGERSATVYVDATAPQTSLAISGGRQAPGPDAASFYASLDTRLSLPAMDPTVAAVASGLDSTSWQDNGGAFEAHGTPIALGAGSHVLSYRSQDHVGNVEVLHSTTVLVDAAAPVTAFQIGSPAFTAADGTRYVTPATPVTFSAADPDLAAGTPGSGVERIEVSVDGAPFTTYTSALTFAEGRHTVQYRAVDRVGNVEAAQTLALRADASAPLTSLAAQGGRQVAGPDANSFYASLDTRFALPAADPIVADVAAGVDVTRWRDNGGALEVYSSPIALAEGSHLLAYQSQDKVQNLEVPRSTTVRIDATAPLTAFNIGAPAYTDAAGVHYVTPTTPLTFTAHDPALPGGTAGSGVERIEVALDAANFQTYSAALTFAEGRHSIRFRAYDKVGNVEAERTLEVRSDASAPLSSLAVQGGRHTAGPDAASQYASADTRIALSASDPLVADVASGVELIRWQDNGGAFQTYTAPLALAEGSHALAYQGQDKVQNVETLRSTTVMVDATAPRTAFQIGTPAFIDPTGTRYITPTTSVTFTAEDPALPGGVAGSGVERIEVAVDGGAFVAYAAALTFPEGRHTVQFRASDRVGNLEASQTLSLRSDASAPLTSLDIQGGRQAAGPGAATFYASSATRYALPATDPVVADVASGVEFTRWQDNGGALMSYSGPIAFPEGVHALTYASEDRVRNVEAQKGATTLVDATPPITQFSLNGPRYAHAAGDQSVGGELFVSPVTGIELATLDPVSNGVASGFERLLASVDGGPFLPWVGAISFAQEGHHAVAYRGADRVGNEEGTRSVSVAVDATAPSTMLTFDGPALVRGPGTTWEPQQAEAFITPLTKVILNTNDPTSAGIASGVKLTRFRIDSGPWQVYGGFFTLSNQGLHLVEFAAEDRVGNVETLVTKRIAVDNTAPLVSAAVNGSWLEAFGLNLLSTAATVSLAANDSSVTGVAVGLARILYRIDDGGLLEYAAPFAMGPGSHTVRYQAVDLLGNTGSPQTLLVSVLRFLGGTLAAKGAISGSGNGQFAGLLQTDAALSLTGNVSATGGADAFSISLKGNATLTGPNTQGVRPLASDSIDLAAIQAALSAANDNAGLPPGSLSGGVLRVSGNQTVTLGTGSYLLSGLELSGNAKLLVSGPVRLFVTGPVRLSGNAALNEAGPARNMAIFGTAASAQLSAAALSAVVYLPSASIEISGNLRLGGSALAASVTLSGNSNATTPGLDAAAPAPVTAGGGQGGSKLASASADGGLLLASGPLDTTFVLRDIYAFPNPAVRGQRPVLHAAVGIADKVTIRLYDIAGQPVHAATIDSAPQVIDDGSGPKYAYEYVWDGHIPSGVYLYVVIAEKSGHAPIKRVGKLAVVR